MSRKQVLAIVADQFREIRKQLDIQLQRMAQIQAQLDEATKAITKLVESD